MTILVRSNYVIIRDNLLRYLHLVRA